ncbi:P-loop containing nucleoside triphosphate hydrolase protein [Panus rudis PR-1116 ss-1]|nr:P-loop containing nucleoside triphosphate hydrolase protein [Panus rudis PR-1116 ss-1]
MLTSASNPFQDGGQVIMDAYTAFGWMRDADVLSVHLNAVLFICWVTFAYRDLWPLATYKLVPADAAEGWILWGKMALLTLAAVVLPVLTPRPFIPLDPENPSDPNPEQTASLLSRYFFFYLTPVISKAQKQPHLSLNDLPPLADYDQIKHLVKRAYPRHIFFGLLRTFPLDFVWMTAMLFGKISFSFAIPISIRQLLSYVENRGEGSAVRPWFWVVCLFFGFLSSNVIFNYYFYIRVRTFIRSQAILIQLLFDHALRIRIKADTAVDGPDSSRSAKSANLTGRLNNLATSDMENLQVGMGFTMLLFFVPPQIIISAIYLYSLLGWRECVCYPFRCHIALNQKKTVVPAGLNVIRMIKMFGWEGKICDDVTNSREQELMSIRKVNLLEILNNVANSVIPILTMIITYTLYTLVMGEELTASRVFASMIVFETVSHQIISQVQSRRVIFLPAKVSLDRINEFLHKTELLDRFTTSKNVQHPTSDGRIGIRQAHFTWSADMARCSTHNFVLRIDDELFFKKGCINLIVGKTGSGKTSLLMALLGELHHIPLTSSSIVSLPREEGIAYHPQESWVLNETIRDNILFGASYDEKRYNAVIEQCALRYDLNLFSAGDKTEVGEKGITLRQARITLARAVYSSASILLLDDVLAALDVHTAKWIVDKCFKGSLLHGRTVILVTHNVALAAPIADYVVSMSNGEIVTRGSLANVLAKDKELSAEVEEETRAIAQTEATLHENDDDTEKNTRVDSGKLIVDEEIAVGRVGWPVLKLFFASMAGKWNIIYWPAFLSLLVGSRAINNLALWILGLWARQYEEHPSAEVRIPYYLALYCVVIALAMLTDSLSSALLIFGSMRASRVIHKALLHSVFSATLRWLDRTPISRIITRCTQDIQSKCFNYGTVDNVIPMYLFALTEVTGTIITKLAAVVIVAPVFLIPASMILGLGYWIGRIYMEAQLPTKRESSKAKAPVLGHFNAAVSGLASIRAYGAQDAFVEESHRRINNLTRANRIYYDLNRWISIPLDSLTTIFTTVLASYLITRVEMNASTIGFSLNMAVGFSVVILHWIRCVNELETQVIEHEPESATDGVPPAYWPASGDLSVEDLSARYSQDGPKVLKNISFHVKSGEHIGIVGRTGSGKSSLTLALLRCIQTEGFVYFDGVRTDTINLDALRSNITIIPQVPELLSGTLRRNLDPFNKHDDATLNDALRAAGLFSLQGEDSQNRITLDTQIAGGGANLSVGQRQILALARAIVRRSKLLILDEGIHYDTDEAIQASLRKRLSKDVTVLTIAHRLQTIMDSDKIMVLDSGKLVEFDAPSVLLEKPDSYLRALVEESGEKEFLTSLATKKA